MDGGVSLLVRYGRGALGIEQYLQHVAMTTRGSIVHRSTSLLIPEGGGEGPTGKGNSTPYHTKMATSVQDQRVPGSGLLHTLQNR